MKWLSLVVMTLFGPVVLGADSGSPKRVLVLYDENKDFSGLALLDRSLTSALKTGATGQLDIYSDFMDVTRFHDAKYEVKLRDFYRQKYAGKKIDLIMAVKFNDQHTAAAWNRGAGSGSVGRKPMKCRTRVLLTDDHPAVVESLATLLKNYFELEEIVWDSR